jgi:lipopolysaccharide/colanic/teichoic acid biosynthesis glycosyltransferase
MVRNKIISNYLRRTVDVCGAGLGLIVLSPLFFVVAIAIKMDTPGPVFYRARRVGKDEKLFWLYKFRSMVADAHKRGPAITTSGDSRVTRVGRILRRTKIDELPQLINVFFGDMSLVGPRPEDPKYVALYTPEQKKILCVRPGITSVASFMYRNESDLLSSSDWEAKYRKEILPNKLSVDLKYIKNRTLWSDFELIFKTIFALFRY